MKKWLQLFFFVCPLLILLAFMNYYVDPANLFHDISGKTAKSLIEGNDTYIAVGNAEMVEVKRALIKNMPEQVECVIVGSSITLCIDSDIVQSDSCLNLSISGATYYDYLAVFGTMEKYEKKQTR